MMLRVWHIIAILPLLMLAPVSQPAHSDPAAILKIEPYQSPKGYVCYRAENPIRIDGRIDDEAWNAAPWTDSFVDIEGDKKPKPRFRTRVKMLWDDECVYFAVEMEEPHVQASMTKHDSYVFHEDNDFEVFIDPDGDNHLYAELEMNSLNTTWDLLLTKPYRDGGKAIDAWEIAGLRTAVHISGTLNDPSDKDRGWTIEIAWPWKGLKEISLRSLPPKDGDQIRLNYSRVEWEYDVVEGTYQRKKGRPEANWVWSPQGAINMHMPERWGHVQFSTAKPGTATFQPDPAGEAKHALFGIYRAQAAYRKQHSKFAATLQELGLTNLRGENFGNVSLETTRSNFEASVELKLGQGKTERWRIAADSRLWKEERVGG
jgi:Carbohydrate family 9 binding domain-like